VERGDESHLNGFGGEGARDDGHSCGPTRVERMLCYCVSCEGEAVWVCVLLILCGHIVPFIVPFVSPAFFIFLFCVLSLFIFFFRKALGNSYIRGFSAGRAPPASVPVWAVQ
jgi:hypothetical protein